MKLISVLAVLAAAASTASAQYVLRGEFNDWGNLGDTVLNDMGGGMYTGTVSGLNPGQMYEYKATTPDWSFNGPGSNARAMANAAGELTVNWFPNQVWADGWQPAGKVRVGYTDSGLHGWDLMGSVNSWGPAFASLSDMGGGLHSTTMAIAAGNYEFKFRKAGDWSISIGDDFGNSAGNATFTASGANLVQFELDLPNGRWRVSEVPTPGAMTLCAVSALVAARRRR